MLGRERRRGLHVGEHRRAKRLGELDARLPVVLAARHPAHQDHRLARARPACAPLLRPSPGAGAGGGPGREAGDVRECDLALERLLLERDVEAHIGGPARRRHRDLVGAQHRLDGGQHRARLVVPLAVVADQRALILGGVDPVDPGPAHLGVARPGGAEHDHRQPRAPDVVDRHGGMHQADAGMQRHRHRPFGHLGVAVRDRDRVLLVQADEHFRVTIAEIVDEAVVQAAIARSGHQRDVAQVEPPQHLGDRVRAPAEPGVGLAHQPVLVVERGGRDRCIRICVGLPP